MMQDKNVSINMHVDLLNGPLRGNQQLNNNCMLVELRGLQVEGSTRPQTHSLIKSLINLKNFKFPKLEKII